MATLEEVRDVKVTYQYVLNRPAWLRGIGIGQDEHGYFIKVNTSEPVSLDPVFQGVRIKTEVVGNIVAL